MDQQFLNEYFGNIWHKISDPSRKNTKSGTQLISKIKEGEKVIDVGCGTNPFKGIIPNLVGIDPAFDQADYKMSIEDFDTNERFDVAFCLGSINFGDKETIERQIKKVVGWLKPNARIYWRCNPGQQDHPSEECKKIDFYPWSLAEHVRLAEKFGFRLLECGWEIDTQESNSRHRLYAEWVRNSQ